MSIEIIQAIIKMDAGSLMMSIANESLYNPDKPKIYEIDLRCRFGNLKAKCHHLEEGIIKVCKMYQTLECEGVTVETVPF